MDIQLVKFPTDEDWMLAKQCTLVTVNKEAAVPPAFEWKKALLKARHSPIRTLQFCFRITDVPYWVSVHLVRHVHAQPFVRSQRNDRQDDYDRQAARQDAPVSMMWYMNAEELITIANKRLCMQAAEETRDLVAQMCDLVKQVCPEFEDELVPMCDRNGGVCHEMFPCGRCTTQS